MKLRKAIAFFILCAAVVPAPARPYPSPSFMRYGPSQGFPQAALNGISQDARGRIWVSTEEGELICYDG